MTLQRYRHLARVLCAALLTAACGDSRSVVGGPDASSDLGPADTGPADTGPADTGPADTGPADTGPADTGPADTGPADTGPRCAMGETVCGAGCVDTATSLAHCGRCDNACQTRANTTATCAAGACGFTCNAGFGDCDGDASNGCETDLSTSAAHCGTCANACAIANATSACVAGRCGITACNDGFGDCDLSAANGCEISLAAASEHCGGCGMRCAPGNAVGVCTNRSCEVASCTLGFANCDANAANGCEVDLRTTVTHCGACNRACASGQVCSAGVCTFVCTPPEVSCSDGCANLTNSVAHCGACGTACPARANATAVCANGACGIACGTGFDNCDNDATNGCEAPLNTTTHCGACGRGCAAANGTSACASGMCAVAACNAGFDDCDRMPSNGCEANLSNSNSHCGACGNACANGATCTNGNCIAGPTGTGSDGALTLSTGSLVVNTVRSPIQGTQGNRTLTLVAPTGFARGQRVFLHQTQGGSAGRYEVRQIVALTGGTATLDAPLTGDYVTDTTSSRAQAVVMPQYSAVTVSAGTVNAPPWDGSTGGIMAFSVQRQMIVSGGEFNMTGRGFRGRARVDQSNRAGEQGEGTLGVGSQATSANGNGGGGGGRIPCECCWAGGGGGGGHATGSTDGSNGGATCQPGGIAGLAVGTPEQAQTIFFGGAGANGGADEDGYGSPGANGGGLIYVIAGDLLLTGGGVRSNGLAGAPEFNYAGCGSGGGGGGAGGAIYLRAATVVLNSGIMSATGGTGGDDPNNCGRPGGNGSPGRITIAGASMVTGTSTPTYVAAP
ncbi:MAG: hypothetical protein JNK72_16270 [Myxococcales bacterium]|nr:hypothetical protein [Myxococcales bacterium]